MKVRVGPRIEEPPARGNLPRHVRWLGRFVEFSVLREQGLFGMDLSNANFSPGWVDIHTYPELAPYCDPP